MIKIYKFDRATKEYEGVCLIVNIDFVDTRMYNNFIQFKIGSGQDYLYATIQYEDKSRAKDIADCLLKNIENGNSVVLDEGKTYYFDNEKEGVGKYVDLFLEVTA